MNRIAQLIVHVSKLVEAQGRDAMEVAREQGRELRVNVQRVSVGLAVIIFFGVLALIGAGFILAGLYLALSMYVGPAGGAAITGFLCVSVAAGALFYISSRWGLPYEL